MSEYIELERSFRELTLSTEDSEEVSYPRSGYGGRYGWSDLAESRRVVILSEAGSGKTEEIKHAAKRLRTEGKSAFFLRLENVADDFETIAFEEGTFAEFSDWLASAEEGWLFLDSVDEARLREPRDFERAIRKIGHRLASVLQRTHIVLTSRGTAWRPVTDLKLCSQYLPYTPPKAPAEASENNNEEAGKEGGSFKVVALDDLGSRQVALFAKAKGITDPKPFLDAIERADAWSLVARPDDLVELIEFWNNHQRIGNRLELMQSSIQRRLAERDQSRADATPLSIADARLGARSVAAACTMAQESAIRVPDGTANTKGIPVWAVLPGWDDKKCATLLARPIFDEAIYQTVRFHHRTVREYLTAEWFKELLDKDTSRRKIEALFFREQYGLEVVVPAMRPVLVWLILLDEKIRERALAISPELIFEGGEPKALPVETRIRILREVCDTMDTGVTRSTTSDYRAVQRFAHHDLTAEIKALLAKYPASAELRWFLLRMVWQGEIVGALPEAKQVAHDRRAERFLRVAAFRAVLAVGSDEDRWEMREHFLKEAKELNREWFAELVSNLPLIQRSVTWLLACIAKLKHKEKHTVDPVGRALDGFIQQLDLDLAAEFLTGLRTLIGKAPVLERRFCEISVRHGWLMECAGRIAERLISARHRAALEKPCLATVQRLPSAQYHHDWEIRRFETRIPNLVPAWPELNRTLFWFEAGEARRIRSDKKGERLTEFWQVSLFGSYYRFSAEDFDWALEQMQSRTVKDDRLIALSLAFKLFVEADRPKPWADLLHTGTARSPALKAALHTQFNPPPPAEEQKRWRQQEEKYQREWKQQEALDAKQALRANRFLRENPDSLCNPGFDDPTVISTNQHYLHEKIRESEPHSHSWTGGSWTALEAEFGQDVAQAFRDGVVAYWRRYRPGLRSEGKANNSTPFSVIFGLTGLNIESRETPNWVSTLKAGEPEVAFRYAMDELNGFPEWFPALYEAQHAVLAPLILHEVDWNLKATTAKHDPHYVLADLSSSGAWAWPSIALGLFERLKKAEPKNLTVLGCMLHIVMASNIDPAEMARLAETRSADRRLAHAGRWFAIWAGVEPEQAIAALDLRLSGTNSAASQTMLAMQFITHLLGGRREPTYAGNAFRKPKHLKDLYLLMHRYIREREDIQRAGKGVYSPGVRDGAQEARNQLFAFLKEIPGKEAYLALRDLAQLHPELSSRPWMQHHAKAKAELDADLSPWTIEQTLDFQTQLERTPANHRELFELMTLRLLDLKDGLEHGDSSIADILIQGATLETSMRKYIGDWLRERAQGRYSIPQEEELADAKRPDFRCHGNGFDGPVPMELKLADNWSGLELFERLENQLCGDYLRDNRSNRGLFVLVRRSEKKGWRVPSQKKQVDFAGLVEALQRHWEAISGRFPKVDDIRVVGVDLMLRTS